MSNFLWTHRLQHARFLCPSPTPRACSNPCPLGQWCHLIISPSVVPLSNEPALLIRWSKYWSFSYSTSPFNEYSGLIFYRTDRFDLLAVQGTFKSLLQHHSSKAPILQCSAFFMAQLSHPYMTARKTIALTRQIFVGKVMSLLYNMLFRFAIAFLPESKHLLISWMQLPSFPHSHSSHQEASTSLLSLIHWGQTE